MSRPAEWRALGLVPAALLLGLLVLASSLALGGIFAYACGLLALCAGVLVVMAPLPTAPRRGARTVLGVGVGLSIYTALTLVPLPLSLLARLAPAQAAVWERSLRPLGESPTWAPLSLDPIATANELTKLLLYGCVFVMALALSERRHGTSSLERLVCAVTATVAVVSLGHWAAGQTMVFGIYQPDLARAPRHVTVFLNANHLSEVMAIGGSVGAGVLISSKERGRRIEGALTLALATLGSAVAASRGGLVALAIGAGVALIGSRGRLGRRGARWATLGLVLVGALAIGVVAASEEIATETFSRDLEKIDIFRQSLPLLFRYGLFGIGRGAFEAVSSEARLDLGSYVFTHPENLLLQWSIEWGVVATAIVLYFMVRSLAPGVLRGRAVMPWGGYGALLAFVLQNQVDYGSEVPGIMLLVLCCLALVTGGARATAKAAFPPDEKPKRFRLAAGALGTLTLAAGLYTFVHADHELWVETRELTQGLRDHDFRDRLQAAIRRHPAEAHFAYLGALRASTVDGTTVLPWVNRTLERSPVHGRAHLLLARELERRSPAQARLEYRLAYAQDYRTHAAYLEGARRLAHGYDEALELVPRAKEEIERLELGDRPPLVVPFGVRLGAIASLTQAIAPTLPASRERLLQAHVEDASRAGSSVIVEPLAHAAVDDVVQAAPWCLPPTCLERARELSLQWLSLAPSAVAPRLAIARLLALTDVGRALAFLAEAEADVDDVPSLLLASSELAESAQLGPTATQLLDRAVDRCVGADACGSILTEAVRLEQRRGRTERALVLMRRKSQLHPQDVATWREQAALAERLGLFTESLEAWDEVLLLAPGDPAAGEAQRRLRTAQRNRSRPVLPTGD